MKFYTYDADCGNLIAEYDDIESVMEAFYEYEEEGKKEG